MKSLSYKIGLGYFVLICINISIALFAIYYIHRLGSPIDRVLREKYQNVSAAENMIQSLKQQELAQTEMLEVGPDSALVNNFHTYKNEFLNWHQRAIEGIALPSEPDLLDSIMANFRNYVQLSDSLQIFIGQKVTPDKSHFLHQSRIAPVVSKLESLVNQLRDVNQKAIVNADQHARKFSSQGTILIIIIALIAIMLSILASIRFTRTILKPVKETTDTVRKIARGQLNQKIQITTDDEIAELGREFNRMTSRLEEYEQLNIRKIISEKKKSEAIVEGLPVAIIVTDQEEKINLMNPHALKILEISQENWQGKTAEELISDQETLKILSPSPVSKSDSFDPYKSLVSIKKDHQELFFFKRQVEIRDDNGKIEGLVTILQDVTRFKDLDRLKSEFMATISHEFRTPLTSVNMAIDILSREVLGRINPEQRELLTDAKNDCLRLKGLVKDLLDLSKLESGKYPMNYQKVKVKEVLEYALKPVRLFAQQKNIEIKVNLKEELILEADFQHLARVITNLVENAIQYEPEGGNIVIDIKSNPKQITFCIRDHGPGIPSEALDLIFDKFVRVKDFKDAEEGNIGLGLAIAKEVINMHSGKIWVESKPGAGSRFYFTLPVHRTRKHKARV
jgi:two-component system, NtrC family, sensor histidine kinase KinB